MVRRKRRLVVRGGRGWWPARYKSTAQRMATKLRKRGYKVRVEKGTTIWAKSRGIKYQVSVHGKRKRR